MPKKNSTSQGSSDRPHTYGFLSGGGPMAKLIKDYDWSKASFGGLAGWDVTLRTTVSIILQSPVPMVILWGEDGVMIYNDAYSVFAGARHPKLLGSKVLEGWPEVSDFNRHVLREVLQGRRLSYVDQHLLLYRNNVAEDVWCNLRCGPVVDEAGKPRGVLAIVVETTERVLAEQQLAKTRGQLNSALEVGRVSTWWWDMKKDIVTGDDNLAYNFGINPDALQEGLPLQVFINAMHEDDRQRVAREINATVQDGVDFKTEYRTIGHEGQVISVIARGQVLKDHDGSPAYFSGILVDITDRKEAEQELETTKQMFDALFNSNVVAIAMATTAGRLLKANKTFLTMFGYSVRDLKRGLTSRQLTSPRDGGATPAIYDSLKATGEAEPVERLYIRKDGTEFPGLMGAAMLPDSDDAFVAFILDMSENQRLKELNSAKDEFIALASHQLRTPATAVKQYLGVLMQGYAGSLGKDQMHYVATANSANDRQLAIINDLLKTAKIDTSGYSLTLLPKNIKKIVAEVASRYMPTLHAKRQKFDLQLPRPSKLVSLDENEFAICVASLIENASKYSPDGYVITVKLSFTQGAAELVVKDRGVGITASDQSKIFDKFTQVDNKLSDTVDGNGLGLYWVRRIIDAHNGTVKLTSVLGKGTSFTVRLPYEHHEYRQDSDSRG